MPTSRREFVEKITVGAAMFGALPLPLSLSLSGNATKTADGSDRSPLLSPDWDLTWVNKLTGKHKAVFDVPEVESGYGVWRATVWTNQYHNVLNVPVSELSPVVVLRHNGIVLAMQQSFWDKYGIGKAKNVTHPVTTQPTDRNPVLLSSTRGEIDANFDPMALDKFIGRGGVALACDLALQDCIRLIQSKEGVSAQVARQRAIAAMVPGVILQPSGVFAALRAQEAGCSYLRAS
jgi:hypothetical protein